MDDVIQADYLHIDDAINHTHHINERFQVTRQNLELRLGNIHTRMDNQQQIIDFRHESVMTLFTKLMAQSGLHESATAYTTASSASIFLISLYPIGYGHTYTPIISPNTHIFTHDNPIYTHKASHSNNHIYHNFTATLGNTTTHTTTTIIIPSPNLYGTHQHQSP